MEAISVLYSINTFSFSRIDTIIDFSKMILPHCLNAVRCLEFRWAILFPLYSDTSPDRISNPLYPPYDEATWERVWQVIAGIRALRDLRVELFDRLGSHSPDDVARILEPLRAVQRLDIFEIKLPWKVGDDIDGPFKVLSPPPIMVYSWIGGYQ